MSFSFLFSPNWLFIMPYLVVLYIWSLKTWQEQGFKLFFLFPSRLLNTGNSRQCFFAYDGPSLSYLDFFHHNVLFNYCYFIIYHPIKNVIVSIEQQRSFCTRDHSDIKSNIVLVYLSQQVSTQKKRFITIIK
jgi:hypothetical protein